MDLPHSIYCWFDFESRLEVLCKRFNYYLVDEFLGAVSAWTVDKVMQAKVLQ